MSDTSLQHWPLDQLEIVGKCPVCDSKDSRILESGLIDRMVSPPTGEWGINTCLGCGVAFLSPRPDSESIGAAYKRYYTHTLDKDDLVSGHLRSIKNYFAENYYATVSKTGTPVAYAVYMVMRMLFPLSLYFDAKSRHLFKVRGKPGRLLDIGCGNGEFLRFANSFGWDVVGLDLDEKAAAEARSGGLDVRTGGVDILGSGEKFDFISLSHVIEHVYDPVELIQTCYTLLNDGGTLWLETPNIESIGYALYKSSWRGLEPPRHIMLFNQTALRQLLMTSGFVSVDQKNHGLSGVYMGLASEGLLSESAPPHFLIGGSIRKIRMFLKILSLELIQLSSKKRREFLTLVATR